MNKEEKKRYDRQISDIADKLLIKANSEAFKYTEGVYRDILRALYVKIERYFDDHKR